MQWPRYRTLGARLTAQFALVFAVAMLGIAAALYVIIDRVASVEVAHQLVSSGTVYDRLWNQRTTRMQEAATLLSQDFGFRAAVATGDQATVVSALANLKARMHVGHAFVIGLDGSVSGINDEAVRQQAAQLWDPLDAGKTSGVFKLGGQLKQVAASPILSPALAGWIVFATDLDAKEMQSLASLSAIPIQAGIVTSEGNGPWTRSAGNFAKLGSQNTMNIARHLSTKQVFDLDLGDGNAIALARPLRAMTDTDHAALLLHYPKSMAMAPYRPVRGAIALIALLGMLGMIYATMKTAHRIVRPIMELDDAAAKFALGEKVFVQAGGDDEISRLGQSFNRMVQEIDDRERRIARLAFNDVLTGLPNRTMFQQQLDLHLRTMEGSESIFALHCLGLDHFKSINDTLGHAVGDALLVEAAKRMCEVAKGCFVGRLGGDEFVIIQMIHRNRDEIDKLARALIDKVQMPMTIEGHDIVASTSIGIAIAREDGRDAETLLRSADLALDRAKDAGRGTFFFFEESLNKAAQERRQIETDLRHAIEHGELELYFQPLFDLEANQIGSFEALMRWNHPTRGLISPVDFIPIAEDTGLIVPMGAWAMQEACRHAMHWPEHIRVAVNVSSVQFHRPGLESIVLQALAKSGLAPNRLEIEITESIFLAGSEATLKVLHSLRGLGIRIALDDFGTGYSSLSYLQQFPFDKLKIDRSFIQDLLSRPGAIAVVKAITDLAAAMGMETTAEGVEETAQLEELRAQGCSSVQGFLFSRPVRASAIEAMLEAAGLRKAA